MHASLRGLHSWAVAFGARLLARLQIRETQTTLVWAGLVGGIGALMTVLFRASVHWLEVSVLHHSSASLVQSATAFPWWIRLLSPMIGGLLAGLVLQFGMRLAPGQSSTDYMEAIALGDGVISARASLVKSASSMLTVSTGGSIGREGSMVQLAAMAASLVGRLAKFSQPRLRLLVACGAAAGIASAYNAPIAGALFVSEIVLGSIAIETFGPLVFASVVANVTVHRFFGYQAIFAVPPFTFASNWDLLFYVALGLVAGATAPRYLWLLERSREWFTGMRVPLFLKLGLGGFVVGVISLGIPEVWGNGYSVIGSVLHGHWLWLMLLVVLLSKVLATAVTTGSGAVGGVFTPTLFVGTTLGALFGTFLHMLLPSITSVPSAYALVGMGSFLAATTHAPLTAILMVFEMTSDYQIVLPLMLGCVVGHYTARLIRGDAIYTESLRRKREEQPQPQVIETIDHLIAPNPPAVLLTAGFEEVTRAFTSQRVNCLYVVDGANAFEGLVPLADITRYLTDRSSAENLEAGDLAMRNVPTLPPGASIMEALECFMQFRGERLPVVAADGSRRLLGSVSKSDLLLVLHTNLDQGGDPEVVRTAHASVRT